MAVGAFLEMYRQRHCLSYVKLARHLEFDRGNLWRLCNNEQHAVSAANALKIARKLGVSVEELLDGPEEGPPSMP